eukprot:4953163-Amphidinium_carterae.1
MCRTTGKSLDKLDIAQSSMSMKRKPMPMKRQERLQLPRTDQRFALVHLRSAAEPCRLAAEPGYP